MSSESFSSSTLRAEERLEYPPARLRIHAAFSTTSFNWTGSFFCALDADGEIVEWFGAASDITEHKHAVDAFALADFIQYAVNHSVTFSFFAGPSFLQSKLPFNE
jgi:hypothetical protein